MRYLTIAVAATAAMAFASAATAESGCSSYKNQSVKAPQEVVQSTVPSTTTTTTTTKADEKG